MTAQQLKNSILQMAVQGKLVHQDPNDEPASILLERIRTEKERLIQEKKIKREKNPSIIFRGADNIPYEKVGDTVTPLEVPFEIPESWEWVRLGEIFQHNTGKALNSANRSGERKLYITTSNLYWDKFELDHLKEMYFTDAEIEKCTATKGDLLVCEGGDIGRAAIWEYDYDICIQNHIHRLRAYITVCTKYFYYLFYLYKHIGWIGGKGIGIQGLSANAIHILLFPLPPLKEQHRIVAKIEELMPFLEKYGEKERELSLLNSAFPEALKKSILQQAVQGKLVPQDPVDEPAAVLLERIRAEKQRFVQEGKIKKDKHESIIFRRDNSHYELVDGVERCIDEEIPFEIPENWVWVRFSNLMKFISTGPFGSMLHKSDYILNGIPLVNPANIINGKIVPSDKMMVSQLTQERLNSYILEAGMIVMGRRGEMGRCAVVTENESGWLCGTGSFFMKPIEGVYAGYISLLFSTPYAKYYLGGESVGTTMSNLNHKILSTMPIPFPPLGEQMRIVAKIEKLLPIVKSL